MSTPGRSRGSEILGSGWTVTVATKCLIVLVCPAAGGAKSRRTGIPKITRLANYFKRPSGERGS
jgi:hypothetical protein